MNLLSFLRLWLSAHLGYQLLSIERHRCPVKQDKRSKIVSKNMLTDGKKTGINLSFTQEYHIFA